MFKHEKMVFHPVSVEKPNPQYAVLLQEQLGGGNGELKPAPYFNIIRESGENAPFGRNCADVLKLTEELYSNNEFKTGYILIRF